MYLNHQLKQLYGGDNIATTKVVPSLFFAFRSGQTLPDPPTFLYHGRQINDKISNNEKYSFKENLKRINHPPLRDMLPGYLVGSCNGLVCTFIQHHGFKDPIYIFNPITREYVYLPELIMKEATSDMSWITVRCGFGYVKPTNEYKIIRIYYSRTLDEGQVEVYTLGGGCGWRDKGTIHIRLLHEEGIHTNGAIYWLGEENVVAFDLADEEFRFLPSPPCINCDRTSEKYGLLALRGLSYGLVELGGHLCYDSRTETLKMISDDEEVSTTDYFFDFEAIPHISTFASLKAMGEKSKIYLVDATWEETGQFRGR